MRNLCENSYNQACRICMLPMSIKPSARWSSACHLYVQTRNALYFSDTFLATVSNDFSCVRSFSISSRIHPGVSLYRSNLWCSLPYITITRVSLASFGSQHLSTISAIYRTTISLQLWSFASITPPRLESVKNPSSRSNRSPLEKSVCRLYPIKVRCTNARNQFAAQRRFFQNDLKVFQAHLFVFLNPVVLVSSLTIVDIHSITKWDRRHEKICIEAPRKNAKHVDKTVYGLEWKFMKNWTDRIHWALLDRLCDNFVCRVVRACVVCCTVIRVPQWELTTLPLWIKHRWQEEHAMAILQAESISSASGRSHTYDASGKRGSAWCPSDGSTSNLWSTASGSLSAASITQWKALK